METFLFIEALLIVAFSFGYQMGRHSKPSSVVNIYQHKHKGEETDGGVTEHGELWDCDDYVCDPYCKKIGYKQNQDYKA